MARACRVAVSLVAFSTENQTFVGSISIRDIINSSKQRPYAQNNIPQALVLQHYLADVSMWTCKNFYAIHNFYYLKLNWNEIINTLSILRVKQNMSLKFTDNQRN